MWNDGHIFTANIVWCEEKYAMSPWIAEFWNSTTNIPFVALAAFCLWKGWQIRIPWRFLFCYLMVMAIGVGSFIFHATLRYEAQLLDELPMMILAGQAIFSLTANSLTPVLTRWIIGVLIYGLITLGSLIYIKTNIAIVHQFIFGLFMAAICYASLRIHLKASPHPNGAISMGRAMLAAFFLNLAAFIVWLYDQFGCGTLRELRRALGHPWTALLQFHAWWHLLTALGSVWFISGLLLADPFYSPQYRLDRALLIFPRISLSEVQKTKVRIEMTPAEKTL